MTDSDEEDPPERINSKHNAINIKCKLQMMNYLASEHAKDLQQSQYIKIETNAKNLMKRILRSQQALVKREALGINDAFKNRQLFARFCKEKEVYNKNQIFLRFKGMFLAKMK